MKKRVVLIVAACLIFVLAVVVSTRFFANGRLEYDRAAFAAYSEKSLRPQVSGTLPDLGSTGFMKISENSVLAFLYSREFHAFEVVDKRNNYVWSSMITQAYNHKTIMNRLHRNAMKELFTVNYIDSQKNAGAENTTTSTVTVMEEAVQNGISLHFDFTDIQIRITLDLWLDNNSLNASIPIDSIREYGKNTLTSIDLLPMLAASNLSEDGYIVYPDGCGSVYRFGSDETEGANSSFMADVYSDNNFNLDTVEQNKETKVQNVMLPAFGVIHGNNGVVGYICDGAERSTIKLQGAGNIYNVDRVFSSMTYHKTYNYKSPDNKDIVDVDKNSRAGDYTVKYLFAYHANKATYGDLAALVRKFLLDTGRMATGEISKAPHVNIQFLMGAVENTILLKRYVPMTTFDQAASILRDIKANSGVSLSAVLLGWQSGGYGSNPTSDQAALKIGGLSGERKFNAFARQEGIPAFLETNRVDAQKSSGGYSKTSDVVCDPMGDPVTNEDEDAFVLNPFKQFVRLTQSSLNQYRSAQAAGVAFDEIGKLLYEDYSPKTNMTKADSVNVDSAMLAAARKQLGAAAAQGGNAYVLREADLLYDLPDMDSGYPVFQQQIPFYQMVVHGHVPYTSIEYGNGTDDFQKLKLKWIEYGSIPTYILTSQDTSLLKDTELKQLFTSRYSDFRGEILALCNEWETRLKGFDSAEMVYHDRSGDLATVRYSNGKTIFINYGETEKTVNGVKIAPMDYTVVGSDAAP